VLVLVLVLLDFVSPVQLWLCGLVWCSINMELELWLWSLSHQK
jgi:hypothetical protein